MSPGSYDQLLAELMLNALREGRPLELYVADRAIRPRENEAVQSTSLLRRSPSRLPEKQKYWQLLERWRTKFGARIVVGSTDQLDLIDSCYPKQLSIYARAGAEARYADGTRTAPPSPIQPVMKANVRSAHFFEEILDWASKADAKASVICVVRAVPNADAVLRHLGPRIQQGRARVVFCGPPEFPAKRTTPLGRHSDDSLEFPGLFSTAVGPNKTLALLEETSTVVERTMKSKGVLPLTWHGGPRGSSLGDDFLP